MRHETKNEWISNEWINPGFGIILERILKHGMKMWQEKWCLIFFETLVILRF